MLSALQRQMLFNVFQALKGLEQRSSSLIDMVSNSTGRTVDVMYATLVHRRALPLPSMECHHTCRWMGCCAMIAQIKPKLQKKSRSD